RRSARRSSGAKKRSGSAWPAIPGTTRGDTTTTTTNPRSELALPHRHAAGEELARAVLAQDAQQVLRRHVEQVPVMMPSLVAVELEGAHQHAADDHRALVASRADQMILHRELARARPVALAHLDARCRLVHVAPVLERRRARRAAVDLAVRP